MIKYNGEELYFELDYNGKVDEWPRNNILPFLNQKKINKKNAFKLIKEFIGNENPFIVAYINQFDMIYLYKLLGLEKCNNIFNWIPVDFASILFSQEINPNVLIDWNNDFLNNLKIDFSKFRQHNALDDAKLLREVYLKLFD